MPVLNESDDILKALRDSRTIAVIGISPDPYKPSYFVADVLKSRGFKLYLVNPNYTGEVILGEKVYASIKDVPGEIDIVDVFRRPEAIPEVAREAKEKGFKTFWMQPGTSNREVAKDLAEGGYNVVVGRCAKTESAKL